MYPPQTPRRPRPEGDCEIDVKKSKTGEKIRFRGRCTKEMLDYAKAEANNLPEGSSKKIDNFDN